MPIVNPPTPAETHSLVQEYLGQRLAMLFSMQYGVTGMISKPHQVYTIDIGAIAAGQMPRGLLAEVVFLCWRYLVFLDENRMAFADIVPTDSGFEYLATTVGPAVHGTVEALRVAEALDSTERDTFELRTLAVAPIGFTALWLHSANDWLLPIIPSPLGIEPYRAYAPNELIIPLKARVDTAIRSEQRLQAEEAAAR